MKVLFLDFDGVLNSAASFKYEFRRKTLNVSNTLSAIACSNLQYILEQDSSVKLVISSTWRKLHSLVELRNILNSYGVEAARIIGKTPAMLDGNRGQEIRMWLNENPSVAKFIIVDDDSTANFAMLQDDGVKDVRGHFFQTAWEDGLLMKQAVQIAKLFRGEK